MLDDLHYLLVFFYFVQGLVHVLGEFKQQFEVSVEDDPEHSRTMGDVQFEHLPPPVVEMDWWEHFSRKPSIFL